MSEDQERSEGRRQGWAEAVAALRDSSRFWEFMETHPMGEDGAEFMVSGNEACADYLASLAASDATPTGEQPSTERSDTDGS